MDGPELACVKDLNHYSATDFGDDRWLTGDRFKNRLLIRPGKKSVAGIETGKSLANHFHYAAIRCSHPETPVGVFEQLENVRIAQAVGRRVVSERRPVAVGMKNAQPAGGSDPQCF